MTELPRQSAGRRQAAVMPPGPEPLYVQFPAVLLNEQANAYVFVTGEDWWAVQETPLFIMQAVEHAAWVRLTIAGLANTVHLRADRIVAVVEPGGLQHG